MILLIVLDYKTMIFNHLKNRKVGEWFFDEECNYNPFISKWKNGNGYLSLNDFGVITNSKEFSID